MKTNTTLLIIISAVLVAGGVLIFSGDTNQSRETEAVKSSSSLSVDRNDHDFGEIDIFAGTVETDFILTNEGSEDVTIIAGTTSCGCTNGSIEGISFGMHEKMSGQVIVKAGESKSVTAVYDPLAHGPSGTGKVTRQLFLKTNSEATPEIELKVSANVVKNEQ